MGSAFRPCRLAALIVTASWALSSGSKSRSGFEMRVQTSLRPCRREHLLMNLATDKVKGSELGCEGWEEGCCAETSFSSRVEMLPETQIFTRAGTFEIGCEESFHACSKTPWDFQRSPSSILIPASENLLSPLALIFTSFLSFDFEGVALSLRVLLHRAGSPSVGKMDFWAWLCAWSQPLSHEGSCPEQGDHGGKWDTRDYSYGSETFSHRHVSKTAVYLWVSFWKPLSYFLAQVGSQEL